MWEYLKCTVCEKYVSEKHQYTFFKKKLFIEEKTLKYPIKLMVL